MQLWGGHDYIRYRRSTFRLRVVRSTICRMKGCMPNVYGICVRCKDVA